MEYNLDMLTPKEKQVFFAIAEQGKTNREISIELGIAGATTTAHIGKIMRTMKCDNRTKLAILHWKHKNGDPEIINAGTTEHEKQIQFRKELHTLLKRYCCVLLFRCNIDQDTLIDEGARITYRLDSNKEEEHGANPGGTTVTARGLYE